MDWQLTVAICAVGVAGGFIAWRGWQTWRGLKSGCGSGGCGCAKKAETAQESTLTQNLTLRK